MKKALLLVVSSALLGLAACSSAPSSSSSSSKTPVTSSAGSSEAESSATPSSSQDAPGSSSSQPASSSQSTPTSSDPAPSSSQPASSSSTPSESESLPTYDGSPTGIAPINKLGSITEKLTTEETGDLHEVTGDETLSGTYPNGIYITTAASEKVTITLKGATIYGNSTSTDSNVLGKAVANKNKKSKVHLYLAPGTENFIYNDYDDVNAVHIKGDLFIEGTGKLTVISGKKNALKATADLKIKDGANVEIKAAGDAIHGEKVTLSDSANVNVLYAGKDGIQAEADSDLTEWSDTSGFVKIDDAAYSCLVGGDGIQADTYALIGKGDLNIKTQGTFVTNTSANKSTYGLTDDDYKWNASGSSYKRASSDGGGSPWGGSSGASGSYALTQSAKGIKVGALEDSSGNDIQSTSYNLLINDEANIAISSTDDAIHVNYGNATILNGNINITTGDDGIHADHYVSIEENANIEIKDSYEGVEASKCYFKGGVTKIASADDAVNAASDMTSVSDYSTLLIENSGGVLEVRASGDGLDSNGDMIFSGGVTTVMGPTTGGNGPLDCGDRSKVSFNGGSVLTVSSSDMLETNSYNTSSSNYAIVVSGISVSKGMAISLLDSASNTILEATSTCSGQAIVVSSPEIKPGSYTLKYGSSSKTLTVSSKITTSGTSGGGGGGRPR